MRVLMVIRPDADTRFGGDRVQMLQTADGLRRLGVDVIEKVGPTCEDDHKGVDVIHLFNLQSRQFSLREAKKIKANGLPLAVSTIWWEPSVELFFETSIKWAVASKILGRQRAIRAITPRVDRVLASDRAELAQIVASADVLLPNSWAEARELRRLDAHDRIVVVPNGVDVDHYNPAKSFPRPEWVPKDDYILCAARVERVKGQLGLAKAARALGINCVLAGDDVDTEYTEKCRNYGATPVGIKNRDELAAAYYHARLYVQPSLRETPGLAALEAAAMGCPVVITKNGCTNEYFGAWAVYLDPFDDKSILRSMQQGLRMPRSNGLSEFVRRKYSWDHAAEATLAAYSRLAS